MLFLWRPEFPPLRDAKSSWGLPLSGPLSSRSPLFLFFFGGGDSLYFVFLVFLVPLFFVGQIFGVLISVVVVSDSIPNT